MKSYFFIAGIFLISFRVWSQDIADSSFQLTNIPVDGIILNKGWKFHAGDNPEWAKEGYDDKGWTSVNPALELHDLPEVREAEIGWFRLKFKADSLLADKSLAIVVASIGASEIYLNGKLIYRFGIVSANYKEEQTRFFFDRPFSLRLDPQSSHVIVVRYSFNKKNLYLKFTNARPCMRIVLKANNQAFADYIKGEGYFSTLRSIQVSLLFLLGFLLLFIYFSYRLKKYLYIGVFCFCMSMGMVMHILGLLEFNSVSQLNSYLLVTQVLYIIGAFAFLNGIYTLYKQKKSWFYYFIGLYGLLIIPFFFNFPDWSGIYNACFFPLINFEFLRLNLQGVRRRTPGAWILLITSILFALGIICFIWLSVTGERASSALLSTICFVIPGIGLSLFFAGEFAHTLAALHLRVLEVEQLSQKTIAQEKEKQQILLVRQQQKSKHETELLELESKALRAQMNPHFIFNCMNSIKSLIQQDEKDKAVTYFTTFSKLIRTIFQNSDKREITLFDEIETCRLYTQLEGMRVGNKLSYSFSVDETIDLKSIMVPALILQPFIENAIWHGIVPKEGKGTLNVSISKKEDKIWCVVDDDGIGREISLQSKFKVASETHQSKGVRLTQSRLELDNLLNERNASVEIIDKKQDNGSPAGTKVILILNEY